jgi:hypothetical protein
MSATAMLELVRRDLRFALGYFPLECLQHVRDQRHRLIRGAYRRGIDGCLFNLLSERLPVDKYIDSRNSLTRFFTGGTGCPYREMKEYQPARWLVRLIDGETVARYGNLNHVDWDFIVKCIEEVICEREAIESAVALMLTTDRFVDACSFSGKTSFVRGGVVAEVSLSIDAGIPST